MEEVPKTWKRLYNEELHNLNTSPDIIGVTKPRRVRWEGNIACVGEKKSAYKILIGKSTMKN
jgi:hypothetical protein